MTLNKLFKNILQKVYGLFYWGYFYHTLIPIVNDFGLFMKFDDNHICFF